MAEEVVGKIVYQVDMETGRLLSSQREVNRNLDQMESGFNKSAKSATNLESGMNKLASAIKLVMAAAALRGLADMVQKYEEMSDRVRMATSSQTEFDHVQQRLLKTANGTYRSLAEAQELYITTAASLRSMNYTTDQAIDVQDSMSYAFVKNATSADRANGAISAFSRLIHSRMSMTITALGDGEWVNLGDMIQLPDPYDENQQQGYIVSRNGNDFETSERIDFSQNELFVVVTDNIGYPVGNVRAYPRSDTDFGFTAEIPDVTLNIWNGYDTQSPSRFIIASESELLLTKWTITDKTPNTNGTTSLTLSEYSDSIYEYSIQ